MTTALLNARRQFFASAYSPVVNNLVTIAAIVAASQVAGSLDLGAFRRDTLAVLILGLGTTSGYLVQLGLQLAPQTVECPIEFLAITGEVLQYLYAHAEGHYREDRRVFGQTFGKLAHGIADPRHLFG